MFLETAETVVLKGDCTRCFVALEVDDEVKDKLAGLIEKIKALGVEGTFPSRGQLHITLAFLGELNEEEANEKISVLKTVSFPAFEFEVRGVGFFPNRNFVRTAWAGVGAGSQEVRKIQAIVSDFLGHEEDRPFVPHVALARIRTRKNVEKLLGLQEEHEEEVFGRSKASSIVFKKSTLTPNGPVYEDLETIKLI
jgi:2'-5' RNA ligase